MPRTRLIEEAVPDCEKKNEGLPLLVAGERADEDHGYCCCGVSVATRRECEEEVVVAKEGCCHREEEENELLMVALLAERAVRVDKKGEIKERVKALLV